jgi:two-component system sensor histidine kinase/response regulator
MLRYSVRDTGVGMAPEMLARLFKPFEIADSSTTRRHGGIGLGLATCKRLADSLGGYALGGQQFTRARAACSPWN